VPNGHGRCEISSSPKVRLETADLPRVEWAPIANVRPNPKNARTHSKKQIRQIAASVRKFGFLNPLIVDDENVILAGHGRLEGARLEGMAQAPIVRFGHLSEAQKRAHVIADNKIAEQAGWDRELLSIELRELIELLPIEGFDVSITGFETGEVDLLLADMGSSRPESEDLIPALRETAATRSGDLWLLGKHQLLCGDSRRPEDFDRAVGAARAAVVVCDPPYNVRVRGTSAKRKAIRPDPTGGQ
jgi:ParB-like chromosome segregation protein Spo0J